MPDASLSQRFTAVWHALHDPDRHREIVKACQAVAHGFDRVTLNPSPVLRQRAEQQRKDRHA